MGEHNDGGPAFAHGNPEQGGDPGMSLRDWFAGQALVGILSTSAAPAMFGLQGAEPRTAETAYVIADAMLAARQPKGTDQ